MAIREIERHPKVPKLNDELIELLTRLCFRPDDPLEPVDLIFVFSSTTGIDELALLIEDLLSKKISKRVFISGGIPNFKDAIKIPKPESALILERIDRNKFPDVEFFTESKSKNTLENLTEALKILDFKNYKKILFIFKRHDPRRAYLTLRKFLPNIILIQKTFSPVYPNTDRPLDKNTWYTYDFGIGRVWGEFLRIKTYGQRGDIAYDKETEELVNKIENLY